MLFQTLLLIITLAGCQTASARQSIWHFRSLRDKPTSATQPKQDTIKAINDYTLTEVNSNLDNQTTGLLGLSLLSIAAIGPIENSTNEETLNPSDSCEQRIHDQIKARLPWKGLQLTILQYELSKDCHLQWAGVIYLGHAHVRITPPCIRLKPSLETQSESVLEEIPKTPPRSNIVPIHYSSPNTRSLYQNVWAEVEKESVVSNSSSISNLNPISKQKNQVENIFSRDNTNTPQVNSNPESSTNSKNKHSNPPSLTYDLKSFVGIGGTIAGKYNFLHPQPQCTVYWSPCITMLYPFYNALSPTISLSLGVGIRWVINSKLTIDVSRERSLTTGVTTQELQFIKIGCQYMIH